MNQEVWSDWIDHDGQGVPNIGLCWIEVYAKSATIPRFLTEQDWSDNFCAEAWDAAFFGKRCGDGSRFALIIRYRVRKPRALLDLIDLVENLPAPANPMVPA